MTEFENTAIHALEPIVSSMKRDGYEVRVKELDERGLSIMISATQDACEECLAPRSVMVPVIESLLEQNGVGVSYTSVAYPSEASAEPQVVRDIHPKS